jgi:hypothetical protein
MSDEIFLSFSIPTKNIKSIPEKNYINLLSGYSEIKLKYVKLFFGCWIKYTNKRTKEYYSGGVLTELNYKYNSAYLRTLQRSDTDGGNVVKVTPITEYIFYGKTDSEHYRAYLNIVDEYSKIEYKKKTVKE